MICYISQNPSNKSRHFISRRRVASACGKEAFTTTFCGPKNPSTRSPGTFGSTRSALVFASSRRNTLIPAHLLWNGILSHLQKRVGRRPGPGPPEGEPYKISFCSRRAHLQVGRAFVFVWPAPRRAAWAGILLVGFMRFTCAWTGVCFSVLGCPQCKNGMCGF